MLGIFKRSESEARENIILNSRRTPEKCVEAVVKRLKFIIEQARIYTFAFLLNRSRTGRKTQRSGRAREKMYIQLCVCVYICVYNLIFLFNGL